MCGGSRKMISFLISCASYYVMQLYEKNEATTQRDNKDRIESLKRDMKICKIHLFHEPQACIIEFYKLGIILKAFSFKENFCSHGIVRTFSQRILT